MEHWSHEKKQEDLFVLLNSFVFVSLVPNADVFLQLVLNATISIMFYKNCKMRLSCLLYI